MSNHLRLLAVFLLVLCLGGTALGQVVRTGTVFGIVKDETGGVIPGVSVTITNAGTEVSRTVISDDGGRYRADNLDLGAYTSGSVSGLTRCS